MLESRQDRLALSLFAMRVGDDVWLSVDAIKGKPRAAST